MCGEPCTIDNWNDQEIHDITTTMLQQAVYAHAHTPF